MLEIIEAKSKQVPNNEYGRRIQQRYDLYGKLQRYLDEQEEIERKIAQEENGSIREGEEESKE